MRAGAGNADDAPPLNSAARRLRLAFCGERRLFLDAVAQLLTRRGHVVAATTVSVPALLPGLVHVGADVVVIDGSSGDVTADVARLHQAVPDAAVLITGGPDGKQHEGSGAGRVRLVSQSVDLDELVRLVEELGAGRPAGRTEGDPAQRQLTRREREVLRRLSKGETTAEIARSLGIAESTAREHVQNVLRKLGVHTRAQAVSLALGEGLL